MDNEPIHRQPLQKRYVSKREYIVNISKRLGLQTMKWVVSSIGGLAVMCIISCVGLAVYVIEGSGSLEWMFRLAMLVVSMVIIPVCIGCWRLSRTLEQKSKSIDSGVLLTKDEKAKLPVEDVLTRPSERPSQYQQDVLLRSVESRDIETEFLVRPEPMNPLPVGCYEQPQSDQNSITIQC